MKALSIKQPFASLIYWKNKTIETRTWQTDYRGPILICSSKTIHTGEFLLKTDIGLKTIDCRLFTKAGNIPTGKMLCVVDLIDCRPMIEADEEKACCRIYPGAWAWIIENVRPVIQKPVKGMLGLYEVPESEIEFISSK